MNKNKLINHDGYKIIDSCFDATSASILKSAAELMSTFDPIGQYSLTQLEAAYTICRYIKPAFEDVLTVFLWPGVYLNKIKRTHIKNIVGNENCDMFCESIDDTTTLLDEKDSEDLEKDDFKLVNTAIMYNVCDKYLFDIIEPMRKKGLSGSADVRRAYNKAKDLHYMAERKTGEPYITHPLRVAKILSEVEMDSNIIVSALLHDTVEDTPYKIEELQNDFGMQVANYVDAVTSLDEELEVSGIDKNRLDELTFKKLVHSVNSDKSGVLALCIKAADRIDNLSTMENMSAEKTKNKIYETERQYLRLFNEYHMNYFVKTIEDLIYQLRQPEEYHKTISNYNNALKKEEYYINSFEDTLKEQLKEKIEIIKSIMAFDFNLGVKVVRRKYLGCEVKNLSEEYNDNIGSKKLPLCQINTVISSDGSSKFDVTDFANALMKIYKDCFTPNGYIILDYYTKSTGVVALMIEDVYKNRFECTFSKKEDWIKYNLGSTEGVFIDEEFDRFAEDYSGPHITVFKRNGAPIELPVRSTPIDLAFAIHSDIGYRLTGVTINGETSDIYNHLHNKDRVVLEYDRVYNHARISWLYYVATPRAREKIIQYFAKMYEGDDPKDDSRIKSKTFMKYLDNIKERISFKDLPDD